MTDLPDLQSLLEIARGATPGPWIEDEAGICGGGRLVAMIARGDDFWAWPDDELPEAELAVLTANAQLIALAPQLLTALIAERERVEGLESGVDYIEALAGLIASGLAADPVTVGAQIQRHARQALSQSGDS